MCWLLLNKLQHAEINENERERGWMGRKEWVSREEGEKESIETVLSSLPWLLGSAETQIDTHTHTHTACQDLSFNSLHFSLPFSLSASVSISVGFNSLTEKLRKCCAAYIMWKCACILIAHVTCDICRSVQIVDRLSVLLGYKLRKIIFSSTNEVIKPWTAF